MVKTKTTSAARHTKDTAVRRKTATRRSPLGHARHILHITPKFVHGMVVGAFVGVFIVGVAHNSASTTALSFNTTRDCSSNAVIHCGALSTSELKSHYNDPGVAQIFRYFKIDASDIDNIDNTVVAGTAYNDGTIKINSTGKIIATDSVSAGRERISGSVHYIKDGVDFYITTAQDAFRSKTIQAYVSLKDGEFQFAIMPNCGNPIMATAVPQSTPKTPPPPTTSTPKPAPKVTLIPTQTPPPQVVTASSVAALPNTGPGAVVTIGLLAILGGYVFHATHRHIRHKRRAHHHSAR